MSYQSWSVVFGEQPSAAKWNILGTNDSSFNDGTGISNIEIGSGHTAVKLDYKFRVYRNSAQNSGGSTPTKVNFDTKSFDTGSNFDVVTNHRFVAPIAGFYCFSSTVSVANSAYAIPRLYKNGSDIADGVEASSGAGGQSVIVSDFIQLSANDYMEVFIENFSVQAIGTGAFSSYFSGFLVSAT